MPRAELIYDLDCPNVAKERTQLLRAFARGGGPCHLGGMEPKGARKPRARQGIWLSNNSRGRERCGRCPARREVRFLPSLRGGQKGMGGMPLIGQIVNALKSGDARVSPDGGESGKTSSWRGLVASMVGAGAALLPTGVCPACWPAYAGVLSSLGLGFLLESSYLFLLIAGMLGLALLTLAYRVKSRHGYGPLWMGVLASCLALFGKFAITSVPVLSLGLALLVAASVWNAWPRKAASLRSCSACAPQERAVESIKRT